jgi:RNA polymerase sigma-70 factor (ECF subfamily)
MPGTPAHISPVDRPAAAGEQTALPNEQDLIRRLKAGEDAAFEELVRALTGRLLAVARRIARTEQDAEDAVQEAFLSAFKSISAFDGRSALSTWLHRITVNAVLARSRRQGGRADVSLDTLLPTFEASGLHHEKPKAWAAVTDQGEARIQQQEALRQAMDQLPDEFRAVLVLRDVEGLDSRAVAESLQISDALVRQRLHRGRQALMKLLEPVMLEESR